VFRRWDAEPAARRVLPREWTLEQRWLDLEKLSDHLLPRDNVTQIKYYTADVRNQPPDNQQSDRQKAYLAALSTLPRVQIIKGHFLGPRVVRMPECDAQGNCLGRTVAVLKTEEKGSDVNLALDLLHDAVKDRYRFAVVISNDSDLLMAIRLVREESGKTVGLVNPHPGRPSVQLAKAVDFHRRITETVLRGSQPPDEVTKGKATVRRPASWG
jgi:uncharacterized LabA/DUF88 family protein